MTFPTTVAVEHEQLKGNPNGEGSLVDIAPGDIPLKFNVYVAIVSCYSTIQLVIQQHSFNTQIWGQISLQDSTSGYISSGDGYTRRFQIYPIKPLIMY